MTQSPLFRDLGGPGLEALAAVATLPILCSSSPRV